MKALNNIRFATILLLFALVGCAGQAKPTVTIISAVASEPIIENQDVTLHAQASDAKGVTRVDLVTEKGVVSSSDVTPPQKAVTVPLTWKSASGSHTLRVFALNMDNVMSEPATFSVNVMPAPAPVGPTPTSVPAPTAVPITPTAAPQPVACTNGAAFVADVTVPDGTVLAPNQAFNKIWRIKNTGTCNWSNYQFVYVAGTNMSAAATIAVPHTNAGTTADMLVAMTAPSNVGAYTGEWQLRDAHGVLFGPLFMVKIVVQGPQPTACVPNISSFTVDRSTINRGESTTIRWGLVTSATSVSIDNGIGGVGTPGSRDVAPQQTTTYTLSAFCGNNVQSASMTIYVNQPAPPPQPTATTAPQPVRRNVTGTWSSGNYHFELTEALGCGTDCGVSGRYLVSHGTMTPEIEDVSGSINVYSGVISLTIMRPGGGSFTGTVNASSNQMSGNLSGVGSITFTK